MTTTHGAVAFNSDEARFFTNTTYRITLRWGGGKAAVHIYQHQPTIDFRHEIKWADSPYEVDPDTLLIELLTRAHDAGRAEAAEHLAVQTLRQEHEPLAWHAPVDMPSRHRETHGLGDDRVTTAGPPANVVRCVKCNGPIRYFTRKPYECADCGRNIHMSDGLIRVGYHWERVGDWLTSVETVDVDD
ncbi:hypothetical protein AB0B15_10510 [Streptomyces sp. NPDC045456]|uniref:hypothetical protein n=1 Tax=Streptomyces sp. NPDC045456 TaxID=3155254 RepID=UPI003404DB36